MKTASFSLGLKHGAQLTISWDDESDAIYIDRQRVGTLLLPTGRLLACDPFYAFRWARTHPENLVEFRRRIPPGEYAFDVSIACYEPSDSRKHWCFENYPPELVEQICRADDQPNVGDQRIALAILSIRDELPVRWELAKRAAGLPDEVDDQAGFPVDTGDAGYVDAAVAEWLAELAANDEAAYADIKHEIERQTQVSWRKTRCWTNVAVGRESRSNLMTCSSGFGSGFFHSFWGLDARGEPVCFVTDFEVLTNCEQRY